MKCFNVDVCIQYCHDCFCFSDCHVDINIYYALFYSTCDYFSVCEML